MHRTTNRSKFNCNNLGHYNQSDRVMDGVSSPRPNIITIIGRDSDPANKPLPKPQARPLRSRLNGDGEPRTGINIRVYADRVGNELLGTALSQRTLATLIEAGFLTADQVEIKGSINGVKVRATIHEYEFDEFKERLTA